MPTLLAVYAAGLVVTGAAVTLLAHRYSPVHPGLLLLYAALWPLLWAALLVVGAIFAPVEIAARLRRRGRPGG